MQFLALVEPVGVKHLTGGATELYRQTHTHTRARTSPYQTAHCGNCHDLMHFLSYI